MVLLKRGFKTWDKALEDDIVVSYNDLVNNHGLRVPKDLAWNDVLTLINEDVILYIRKCERRGQDINAIPKIKILTIHGSKGGEADNVVLLSELSRKSHTSLLKKMETMREEFFIQELLELKRICFWFGHLTIMNIQRCF